MRARDQQGAILEKGAIWEGCYTTRLEKGFMEAAGSLPRLLPLLPLLSLSLLLLLVGDVGVELGIALVGPSGGMGRF
jgi:hypothetical protein